jgi:hypothetical protein
MDADGAFRTEAPLETGSTGTAGRVPVPGRLPPSRSLVTAVLALTSILYLPALLIGFFADDFYWLLSLKPPPALTGLVAPYYISFEQPAVETYWRARGVYFWWASHDFRWTLMRPGAIRLLELEWAAFGVRPLWYHLVSLVSYVGLAGVVWCLYRRVLRLEAALLALFLFATHVGHLQSVWWISNQHSVLSVLFAFLGVLAYQKWRESDWRPGLVLCPLSFAAGLIFGETTIAAIAYVVAYEAFAGRGSLIRRISSLIPLLSLFVGYLALHHQQGYTTRGSLYYLDPLRDPRAFIGIAISRFPALFDGLWNVLLADFWAARPALRPLQAALAAIVCTLLALLLRGAWRDLEPAERRVVAWMGSSALLSLVPGLASPPGGRLLLTGTVGGSVVLAVIFRHAWRVLRRESPTSWRRAYLAGAAPLLLLNLLLPLPAIPGTLLMMGRFNAADTQAFRDAEIDDSLAPTQDFIVLNVPGSLTSMSFLSARRLLLGSPLPHDWTVLTCTPYDLRVTRTGTETLELEVLDGALFGEGGQRHFRPESWPVKVGDVFDRGTFQVRILAVNEVGPTRLEFRFLHPLDDPRYRVLSWKDGTFRLLPMPAPGRQVLVPAALSPFGPGT